MSKTDLLKLIFHHDQRMEQLTPSTQENDNPLMAFTQPDPTYSTLYFSGTVLEEMKFGLNNLDRYNDIISLFDQAFDFSAYTLPANSTDFSGMINQLSLKDSILIDPISKELIVSDYNEGSKLRASIEADGIVLFKRENQNGFDLQLFSKDNIYLLFFYHLQAMLEPGFRFFSINGKRVHNEQFFYFETHRLTNPPHGFEEVFPESVL